MSRSALIRGEKSLTRLTVPLGFFAKGTSRTLYTITVQLSWPSNRAIQTVPSRECLQLSLRFWRWLLAFSSSHCPPFPPPAEKGLCSLLEGECVLTRLLSTTSDVKILYNVQFLQPGIFPQSICLHSTRLTKTCVLLVARLE